MDAELQESVNEWLRLDKNEVTRAEVHKLLEDRRYDEIEHRFRHRIEFGTAGLRGRMEAGWSRMNDLIIIQTSQGLCDYAARTVKNAAQKGVVIGYDHRHNSKRWAELTAAAFIARGFKAYLHRGLVHTPLVPFSVTVLNAAVGVMITASHNPKHDNGYKVYWENGVQIISPHDSGISSAINSNLEPQYWDTINLYFSKLCIDKTDEMKEAYFSYLSNFSPTKITGISRPIKFVHTAMHGVGHPFAVKAFEVFGLPPFISVEKQKEPDPEFPTVAFPNPEEKGALDLAIACADEVGAIYVLAQDPDADRFAAAEKIDATDNWHVFTGDQLGAVFAAHVLNSYKTSEKSLDRLAMVASTVSSKMIEAMARKEGFKAAESLTGFKYIGNTCLKLESEGYEVPFAYEEAIGFMLGSKIRDKDGISAMAVFARMAYELSSKGLTISSYLQKLYLKYGHFKTRNSYYLCRDQKVIDTIFERLRNFNIKSKIPRIDNYPCLLADMPVKSIIDLTIGFDSTNPPTYEPTLPLSSGHMIQFRAENDTNKVGVILTIRTSGTEPKIKFYLEGVGEDLGKVDEVLSRVINDMDESWLEAEKNKLGKPWAGLGDP